jgi:hypothetical protein
MKGIYIMLLLTGLVALMVLTGYLTQEKTEVKQGTAVLIICSIGKTLQEEVQTSGATATQALKQRHNITTDSGLRCIDEICAQGNYRWVFYINDKLSNYGIDNYLIKGGDKIEFRFTNK